jgi:WD40 repeat protein
LGPEITSLACSPDGRFAAAACRETVVIWDHRAGLALGTGPHGNPRYPGDVTFRRNGRLVYLAGGTRYRTTCEVVVCDTEASGRPVQQVPVPDSRLLALAPDDRRAAVGTLQGEAQVWDLEKGSLLLGGQPSRDSITSLAFSPDGRCLAGAYFNGPLVIRDSQTGKETGSHWTKGTSCRRCLFAPDGQTLLAGYGDGSLRLLDGVTAKLQAAWRWHTESISCLALSPDGRWLATAGEDGQIKLWPLPVLLANASLR